MKVTLEFFCEENVQNFTLFTIEKQQISLNVNQIEVFKIAL